MNFKKVISPILISLLMFNVAFASNDAALKTTVETIEKTPVVEKNLSITIEEAVNIGLENSIDLKMVKNEIDMSALKQDRADRISKKLEDGDDKIKKGSSEINKNQKLLNAKKQELAYAEALINAENEEDKKIITEDGKVIPLKNYGENASYVETEYRKKLENKKDELIANEAILDSAKASLDSGKTTLSDSLKEAGLSISENLNLGDLDSYNVDATSNLMTTMADVAYDVTSASFDIYKNQIAMLIQKNYYDVLKAQKIVEMKEKAMERAKKQFQFAKDSYEVGMKAKDDMLLGDVYYKSTQLELTKAKGDLENALVELKKNMNIPLETKLVLTDVLIDEKEIPDLEEGLKSGLANRLELKKTLGQMTIYDLNFEKAKGKYPDITYQYKEANLLKEKSHLEYAKAYSMVESSINQSYETLMTVGNMMDTAKAMVEKAKESVEIAEYKYKEGFSTENSLLKKLDLESAAGTIVEVLAAEENLSNVEEKVVEIMYNYNLAKVKYYNDTGKFIY
ncbi:TolC family protein [Abyssisolibacter fermentans]|uniref:TolC family protein n=1 Tax=Abyssisolibacter fermentans TaxID=1766203 RepID=UPI0008344399|nr:TolC family protein [Abyssisolibacter fermentans]